MKTEFEFLPIGTSTFNTIDLAELKIIGKEPLNKPYISLNFHNHNTVYLPDRDIKLLALNILKSLGYNIKLKKLKGNKK